MSIIEQSIIIDNCTHEWKLKHQYHILLLKKVINKESWGHDWPYYEPQPMKIDSIQRQNQFSQKKNFVKAKKAKKGNCSNCSKQGHFAKECHSKGKSVTKRMYTEVVKRKKPESHDEMFWTTCYDDDCTAHQSDKDSSRWFLKPSKKTFTATQRQ